MLEYTVERWEVWPGKETPATSRSRSPFKTIWTKVLGMLEREVRMLGGRNVVIRMNVAEGNIRRDGQLRADARPYTPGVILEFTAQRLKGAPRLRYACDRFGFWQDNVSAIARALEALRLVDRYGVTSGGEQYAGFKALPSAGGATSTMDVEAAARVVANYCNGINAHMVVSDSGLARSAVRSAVHATHPDRNNGDRADERMHPADIEAEIHKVGLFCGLLAEMPLEKLMREFELMNSIGALFDPTAWQRTFKNREANARLVGALLRAKREVEKVRAEYGPPKR